MRRIPPTSPEKRSRQPGRRPGTAPKPAPERPAPRTRAGAPGTAVHFTPLEPDEVAGFVDLLSGAYPLFMTDRQKAIERFLESVAHRFPELHVGHDPHGRLVGGYALYPFVATVKGRGIPATGLGMVGTALDRKKQHVALQIVRDFVRRTRDRGMPLSFLYPFRHDFYADMGWGSVGESRQHRIRPAALPLYPERESVRWVREPDWQVLDRIHRQSVGRQQSLGISRHRMRWTWMLGEIGGAFLAGPEEAPEGYLISRFAKHRGDDDRFRYDLEVLEMDWSTPSAMRALLGFLSSQRDQVLEVVLDWPIDGHLEAILREPVRPNAPHLTNHLAHGAVTALGVMVRLEDPEAAFRLRPYAGDDSLSLDVRTSDPLDNDKEISFRARLQGETPAGTRAATASLECGLATLSRLWAGALRVREAIDFGLIRLQPEEAAAPLERLLEIPAPRILERF